MVREQDSLENALTVKIRFGQTLQLINNPLIKEQSSKVAQFHFIWTLSPSLLKSIQRKPLVNI